MRVKEDGLEKMLWSIAIPGFGQILNQKYIKGFVFIALELLINTKSGLNTAIIYSFYGKNSIAVQQVNYEWLMFYPCFYMFVIWDAYYDAVENIASFSFLPFVMAAYLGTVGVIYSKTITISGVRLGPVWTPLLFILIGIIVGMIIRKMFRLKNKLE